MVQLGWEALSEPLNQEDGLAAPALTRIMSLGSMSSSAGMYKHMADRPALAYCLLFVKVQHIEPHRSQEPTLLSWQIFFCSGAGPTSLS